MQNNEFLNNFEFSQLFCILSQNLIKKYNISFHSNFCQVQIDAHIRTHTYMYTYTFEVK